MDGIRIEPAHPYYDRIYAAWEENGSSDQFDMILYDDGDAIGGAIFRARTLDGVVLFWLEASERATPIPENDSKLKPHWSFASIRYRGLYTIPKRDGAPGIRYEKLVNNLILE